MKRIISNNKGITGIDLTIGIIVLSIFSGVIISLMVNTYSTVVEIRKSANAMAYATIILEKVDEKSFEKVLDKWGSTWYHNRACVGRFCACTAMMREIAAQAGNFRGVCP